jgi:hypothetical protein
MSQPYSNVALAIQTVVTLGAHSATKFVSPKHVVKVTQRLAAGRLPRKGSNLDFVVTVGSPNYADRLFIKKCLKAGEPFPVKKLQLKFPAKRKPTAKAVRRAKRKLNVRSLSAKVLGQTRARG